MRRVYDSNVLIDFLDGRPEAVALLGAETRLCISRMTWMEVMVGATTPETAAAYRRFLDTCVILDISAEIADRAVSLRQSHRIKLPDAIIWATALEHGAVLVTLNTKDFPRDHATVMVPYGA